MFFFILFFFCFSILLYSLLYNVITTMGGGKTLFATLYAKYYRYLRPNSEIFANYHIENMSKFTYTPFMFLPFNRLKSCLIIGDDFYALKHLKNYTGIIVNFSRKKSLAIILTCQDYTMIPADIRRVSDFVVLVMYNEDLDTLLIMGVKPREYEFYMANPRYQIREKFLIVQQNACSLAKAHYDTNEVVKFPSERLIKEEILKISDDLESLEQNIEMYSANMRKKERLLKELSEKKGFELEA